MARSPSIDTPVSAPTTAATLRGDGRLLTTICIAASVSYMSSIALTPFLPLIARELDVSVALLGQIPAATTGLTTALGIAAGPLADHYGHRRTLLFGLLALVLGSLGTAVSFSFGLLAAVSLIAAISQAAIPPVALAIVSTRFALDQRRQAIGWVVAASSGATIIGTQVLTGSAYFVGWRWAFVALALVTLAILLLQARQLPADAGVGSGLPRIGEMLAAFGPILRHPPSSGLIAQAFIRGGGSAMLSTYLAAFLFDRYGWTVQLAGLAYSSLGVAFFVGSLIAGGWLGRVPQRPLIVLCLIGGGLGLAGCVFVAVSPLVSVGLFDLAMLLVGIISVGATTLLANESPAGQATTMTANQSFNSVGYALGASLGGLLLVLGGYQLIGLGSITSYAIAAIIVWQTRPR